METYTVSAAEYAVGRRRALASTPRPLRTAMPQIVQNASFDVSLARDNLSELRLNYFIAEARVASSKRALKIGKLRPAIVLYDEPHPNGDLIGNLQASDMAKRPDLLIIMGTSLKVYGLKRLVKDFAQIVHSSTNKNGLGGGRVIYVNLTEPSGSEWDDIIDYHIQGSTDVWVCHVENHWRKTRPTDWEIQTTLDAPGGLKVAKEPTQPLKHSEYPQRTRCTLLTVFVLSKLRSALSNNKENRPPPDARQIPLPDSPSKRRSKSNHYDTPSSPSKKRNVPLGDSSEVTQCKPILESDVFL